eukprot:3511000-Rhodomonas_salina.4
MSGSDLANPAVRYEQADKYVGRKVPNPPIFLRASPVLVGRIFLRACPVLMLDLWYYALAGTNLFSAATVGQGRRHEGLLGQGGLSPTRMLCDVRY